MQSLVVKGFTLICGLVAFLSYSHAADYDRSQSQGVPYQQTAPQASAGQGEAQVAPGVRPSWFQPPPEDQHPYVAPPKKRYVPLAGRSTGPVIILPGGNGPQRD
ncbi:hypothetical protein [Pseudovibrio japonicus]|nr:hypothetical protein [Pseudovibrio japonicus]